MIILIMRNEKDWGAIVNDLSKCEARDIFCLVECPVGDLSVLLGWKGGNLDWLLWVSNGRPAINLSCRRLIPATNGHSFKITSARQYPQSQPFWRSNLHLIQRSIGPAAFAPSHQAPSH